jgi:hypothetical protein
MSTSCINELEELEFDWSKKPDPLRPVGGRCEATGTCDNRQRGTIQCISSHEDALEIPVNFDDKEALDIKDVYGKLG